jgi:hypothetical protein
MLLTTAVHRGALLELLVDGQHDFCGLVGILGFGSYELREKLRQPLASLAELCCVEDCR